MKLKNAIYIALLLISTVAMAQTVSVPADELTEQQKQKYLAKGSTPTVEAAHQWVGLGKEIGESFNGALGALTDQTDRFSKTNAGKFTMVVVAWKVMGNEATHLLAGLIEIAIFAPVFIWSYRRSCVDRKVLTSISGPFWKRAKTYEYVKYDPKRDFTPRHGHSLTLFVFLVVWAFTLFSY